METVLWYCKHVDLFSHNAYNLFSCVRILQIIIAMKMWRIGTTFSKTWNKILGWIFHVIDYEIDVEILFCSVWILGHWTHLAIKLGFWCYQVPISIPLIILFQSLSSNLWFSDKKSVVKLEFTQYSICMFKINMLGKPLIFR